MKPGENRPANSGSASEAGRDPTTPGSGSHPEPDAPARAPQGQAATGGLTSPRGPTGGPRSPGDPPGTPLGKPTPDSVREALRPVHDPELMISIVDLGLIYGVDVSEDGTKVEVKMTLTSPGCPIGPELMAAVDHTARMVPGIEDVHVQLVWEPPWDPTKMASESAREQLGIW